MANHPDFIPFRESDFAEIFGSSECSGLEQTMTTVDRNKREFMERQSCNALVTAVTGSCCGGCASGECEADAGEELMGRLRAEEGDHGQV